MFELKFTTNHVSESLQGSLSTARTQVPGVSLCGREGNVLYRAFSYYNSRSCFAGFY